MFIDSHCHSDRRLRSLTSRAPADQKNSRFFKKLHNKKKNEMLPLEGFLPIRSKTKKRARTTAFCFRYASCTRRASVARWQFVLICTCLQHFLPEGNKKEVRSYSKRRCKWKMTNRDNSTCDTFIDVRVEVDFKKHV